MDAEVKSRSRHILLGAARGFDVIEIQTEKCHATEIQPWLKERHAPTHLLRFKLRSNLPAKRLRQRLNKDYAKLR